MRAREPGVQGLPDGVRPTISLTMGRPLGPVSPVGTSVAVEPELLGVEEEVGVGPTGAPVGLVGAPVGLAESGFEAPGEPGAAGEPEEPGLVGLPEEPEDESGPVAAPTAFTPAGLPPLATLLTPPGEAVLAPPGAVLPGAAGLVGAAGPLGAGLEPPDPPGAGLVGAVGPGVAGLVAPPGPVGAGLALVAPPTEPVSSPLTGVTFMAMVSL